MTILDNGKHEELKAAVHLVGFGFMATCFAYNAAACLQRAFQGKPARHLAINAVLYGGLTWRELGMVVYHWRARPHAKSVDSPVTQCRADAADYADLRDACGHPAVGLPCPATGPGASARGA